MILEVADLRILPGREPEFDAAIERAFESVLSRSPGYVSHQIQKGIESPQRYLLLIQWQSVEAHEVGFRQSPLFQQWRGIIGPFFAEPPKVEHFSLLAQAGRG